MCFFVLDQYHFDDFRVHSGNNPRFVCDIEILRRTRIGVMRKVVNSWLRAKCDANLECVFEVADYLGWRMPKFHV